MPTPAVSVLLPIRQAQETLTACLASLRRQTWTDWECLLLDDGSSDGSGRLCVQVAQADPRFRWLPATHAGLIPTLNRGLEAARAPLLARLDADDLAHRRRLELQSALLARHEHWAGVGCHVRLFPRSRLTDGARRYEAWLNAVDSADAVEREAFVECPLAHPGWMLRRSKLPAEGYRDMGWPEDYDLLLRLLGTGRRLGVVPHRLLLWRDRPERLQRTDPRYAQARFVDCKAAHLAAGPLSNRSSYVLWGHGGTGRALRAALARHGKRPERIVELHPARLGNRIDGAPVEPPSTLQQRRPEVPILVSVAGSGPRGEIRRALASMGYREGRDFICAA